MRKVRAVAGGQILRTITPEIPVRASRCLVINLKIKRAGTYEMVSYTVNRYAKVGKAGRCENAIMR